MPNESVVFDRAVEYYDQTRGFPPGVEVEAARLFARAGDLTKQSRVLEVGVGTGRIALPVAAHVGAYIGLDLSLPMMLKLVEKPRGDNVQVVQGDATHLPFADATFDAVVAVHFFHLVPTWRDVLRELKRVLRPGGRLLHGWNERGTDSSLDAVWRDAVSGRRMDAGVPFEQREMFLPENGWTQVGEQQTHVYATERVPQAYIDALRERRWSQTWSLSDETLSAAVAQLEAFIREQYPDPTAPILIQSSFSARAYEPNRP